MKYLLTLGFLLMILQGVGCKKKGKTAKDIAGTYIGITHYQGRYQSWGQFPENDSTDTVYVDTVVVLNIGEDSIEIEDYKFKYAPGGGYRYWYGANGSSREFEAQFTDMGSLTINSNGGHYYFGSSSSYSEREFSGGKQ